MCRFGIQAPNRFRFRSETAPYFPANWDQTSKIEIRADWSVHGFVHIGRNARQPSRCRCLWSIFDHLTSPCLQIPRPERVEEIVRRDSSSQAESCFGQSFTSAGACSCFRFRRKELPGICINAGGAQSLRPTVSSNLPPLFGMSNVFQRIAGPFLAPPLLPENAARDTSGPETGFFLTIRRYTPRRRKNPSDQE